MDGLKCIGWLLCANPLFSKLKWPTQRLVDVVDSDVDAVETVGVVAVVVPAVEAARMRTRSGKLFIIALSRPIRQLKCSYAQGARHQTRPPSQGRQNQVDGGDLPLLSPDQRVPNRRLFPTYAQG